MSFILSPTGAITEPVNAPIDITANTAAPYYAAIAYTWNITNLDDYTTYNLTTTNGTIIRSGATLTYTPASSGAGGWTMNGRAINLTILNYVNFIQKLTGANGRYANIDSSGNIYLTNNLFGVAKLNSLGVVQWSRRTTVTSGTFYASYTDANGNTYLVGTSGAACATIKYDSSGIIQWQKTLNQGSSTAAQGVTADSSGNVYIVGYGWNASSDNDCLIAKYNSAGVLQFQKLLGVVSSAQQFFTATVDQSNNIIAGGYNSFTALPLLVKYNSAGVLQWQVTFGVNTSPAGVVSDASGNIYFAATNGSLTKFNSSGVVQWSRILSGAAPQYFSVALDPSGNVYAFGKILVSGNFNFFIAKYNSAGVIQFQRTLGVTVGSSAGYGIAVDATNIYVNGEWPGGGYLDAVLPNDGSKTGSYTVAGSTVAYSAGTSTDASAGYVESATALSETVVTFTDATSAFVDSALALTSTITPI